VSGYVLPHQLQGEQHRLALMSELLDPWHRSLLKAVGLKPDWRCLEVGCGNGSISKWLSAEAATGHVVATDVNTTYIADMHGANLEVRALNILDGTIEQGAYDLVTARAVVHHLPDRETAVRHMVSALKPGGVLLSIEPDMLPATVADPESLRRFWQGWLGWSASAGIDYFIGRKMPGMLAASGLRHVEAFGNTAIYNGDSPWATYWLETLDELRPKLVGSGLVSDESLAAVGHAYRDPNHWTSAITFVGAWGFRREGKK
jgi:SAM-dependent methyltransferase